MTWGRYLFPPQTEVLVVLTHNWLVPYGLIPVTNGSIKFEATTLELLPIWGQIKEGFHPTLPKKGEGDSIPEYIILQDWVKCTYLLYFELDSKYMKGHSLKIKMHLNFCAHKSGIPKNLYIIY